MSRSPSGTVPAAAARLLIVDQDEAIRDALATAFAAAGYVVTKAGTGAEAAHLIARTAVDLVLVDQALPGLIGADVFAHLLRLTPAATKRGGTVLIIEKPFDFTTLLHAVAQRLGAGRVQPPHQTSPS